MANVYKECVSGGQRYELHSTGINMTYAIQRVAVPINRWIDSEMISVPRTALVAFFGEESVARLERGE